jgi:predicted anti-sigma-YlaC factor YlaD
MRCDQVRPVLPELADGVLREAGPVEQHLASCLACTADLAHYRAVLDQLGAMREVLTEPPRGFQERMLAGIPEARRWRLVHRMAGDERLQYAALSLGGAVVGATAIGLLWWRVGRRTMSGSAAGNGESLAPAD